MDYKFPISTNGILELIPQRPPFLFVDTIVCASDKSVTTNLTLSGEEDFFKGHFPENPIMPGVLLQEAVFQSGAALIGLRELEQKSKKNIGVVARVKNAKFKNFVKPGDTLFMEVDLVEIIGNAFYMKAKSSVNNKVVLSIEFTCALVEE